MIANRLLPIVGAAACMSACAFPASATFSQWLAHSFEFSFQQSKIAPHPNVIKFYGMSEVDISETPEPIGVVKNPMFQAKGVSGTNPMHGDRGRRTPDSPLEAADFISIVVNFSETTYVVQPSGIVHRDIAARNILVSTIFGDYSNALGTALAFSSDGPMDYGIADPKLPIRWSAPEVLPMRLYLNGDASSGDWIDIEAGGTFETLAIPSPAGATLLTLASLAAVRRRR